MLGKKCSLAPLKEELRKQGVSAQRTSAALRLPQTLASVEAQLVTAAEAEPETHKIKRVGL